MFEKISVDFGDLKDNIEYSGVFYTNKNFSEYGIKNYDYVLQSMYSRLDFGIPPHKINLTSIDYPGATPHTDAYSVVMNYYLNADGAETKFWKSKLHATNYRITTDESRLLVLSEIGSFSAYTGDVFLLDTQTIHSVPIRATGPTRQILRVIWLRDSFSSILESIKIRQT
jgi:hypothetical protein